MVPLAPTAAQLGNLNLRAASCQKYVLTRQNVEVISRSFHIKVPKPLERHAGNILAQAETLARNMEAVSGRRRTSTATDINIIPGRSGATGEFSGKTITIGTRPLFADTPALDHSIVHELAHNYGFHHGGFMELVVEVIRCGDAEQISQQAAKWMFIDRMNGLHRKEVLYHDTGLYLYCYARGGKRLLQFLLANEPIARKNLAQQGFSDDETTVGLLNVALENDITPTCLAYGLSATPARIKLATQAARDVCRRP